MPELGPYGSVRGARSNSRPYRESRRPTTKMTRLTEKRKSRLRLARIRLGICGLNSEFIMCHALLICQQAGNWSCSR